MRCNIPERYINPQNVSMSGLTVTKVENPGTGYINRYKRSTAAAVSSSTASVQIGCADDDLTTQCITMQCQIRTFRQSDTVTIKVRLSVRGVRRVRGVTVISSRLKLFVVVYCQVQLGRLGFGFVQYCHQSRDMSKGCEGCKESKGCICLVTASTTI